MKLIHKFKSPNFDERKNAQISFIIIHYTAITSITNSLLHLCKPENKVSCHYLISQEGQIYNLVKENKRAWHAGESFWNNISDLNSNSVGVELDFSNNQRNNKFSTEMINALIYLLKKLIAKYKIKKENILGHSDIAPFRKLDPGSKFPWETLYKYNISFNPSKKNILHRININRWFFKNNIINSKKIVIFIFSYLGYDTNKLKHNKNKFCTLLRSYQSHFIQNNVTGKLDKNTIEFMKNHFINYVLTKN